MERYVDKSGLATCPVNFDISFHCKIDAIKLSLFGHCSPPVGLPSNGLRAGAEFPDYPHQHPFALLRQTRNRISAPMDQGQVFLWSRDDVGDGGMFADENYRIIERGSKESLQNRTLPFACSYRSGNRGTGLKPF